MADKDDLGLLVVPAQEQVQQNEEALGNVLDALGHRAGDIHQTEHHRAAGRRRLLD